MSHRDEVLKVLFEDNFKEVESIVRGVAASNTPYAQEEELEDCVQYVFQKIVEKAEKLEKPQHWKSWTYMLARNYSINHLKHNERRALYSAVEIKEDDDVVDDLVLDDYTEVSMLIDSIDFKHKKAKDVARMMYAGYIAKEIAAELDLTARTVATVIKHVRSKIRGALSESK